MDCGGFNNAIFPFHMLQGMSSCYFINFEMVSFYFFLKSCYFQYVIDFIALQFYFYAHLALQIFIY